MPVVQRCVPNWAGDQPMPVVLMTRVTMEASNSLNLALPELCKRGNLQARSMLLKIKQSTPGYARRDWGNRTVNGPRGNYQVGHQILAWALEGKVGPSMLSSTTP